MTHHARVAIIGGGIVGCSISYHLAQMGWKDVVVIEKGELTCGSTWHAAGLVGQLRSSRNVTQMLKYSVELYQQLEKETGQATGWKQSGGLRLACSKQRLMELKKAATMAKSFGLQMHIIGPKEALDLFPIMNIDKVLAAAYLPTDGYTDPSMTTRALAKGAQNRGVRFFKNTSVNNIKVKGKRAVEITTDQESFKVEIIVNAAGMWAREIGNMVGVNIPIIPVEHQYLVTEVSRDIPKNLPTMRDPDHLIYYKEETGALLVGGYEHNPKPWKIDNVPRDFEAKLLESNFERFGPLADYAMERTPLLENLGVKKLINGPEAFTPDGHFIMGKAPELENFYVATGFNAHGIAAGGGVGKMMAQWIIEGKPGMDLWAVDILRFGRHHRNINYVKDRTLELYKKHYSIAWPYEEHSSVRKVKRSPLYHLLLQKRAVYGNKFGWERPNWFAPKGIEAKDKLSFDDCNWTQHVAQEHQAIREKVALIDQSSFSKFEVEGPEALNFLQYVAVNDIDKPIGSLIYTQFCNQKGGIEADLVVARLEESKFYIVTGTAFGAHDFAWLNEHKPQNVFINDITNSKAVINVCGPFARKLLQKVSSDDISSQNFPFAQCRFIQIGYIEVLALRITYVGELGWELHIATENASYLYELLWQAGEEFGIANAGYRGIESCRLEKGYRYWSKDLTPDYSPYAAGLGFCVKLSKENFIGKKALQQEKEKGPKQKLCCFVLGQPVSLYGGETICFNKEILGVVTSGGFGHTINKTIALGYIPRRFCTEETFTIESFGESISAKLHKKVLYDPKRKKILN